MKNLRKRNGDPCFNKHGEFVTSFQIVNWRAFGNGSMNVRHIGQIVADETAHENFSTIVPYIKWRAGARKVRYSMFKYYCTKVHVVH